MSRAPSRFDEWLTIVWETRNEASHPLFWLAIAVVLVGIMAIMAFAPAARDVFQLQFVPALLCLLPALLMGFVGGTFLHGGRMAPRSYGIVVLIGTGLFQFYFGALVALTIVPGAYVVAPLFVVTAVYHGYSFRASKTYPYAIVTTLAAAAGAVAMSPTPGHLALFAVLIPMTLGTSLLFGHAGLRNDQSRQEQVALRAAIQAQVIDDSTRDRDELAGRLLRLLESSHDASSGLSALFFQARLIQERSRALQSPESFADMATLAESLSKGLERIRALLEETRRVRAQTLVVPQAVDVMPAVRAVLDGLRAKAGTRVALGLEQNVPDATQALIAGGAASLERVLHNVVTNALEGNGVERGTNIEVRVYALPGERMLAIDCLDDGPGFRPEQLAGAITAFATLKTTGTGLGLYTAERLLRAGGGEIIRSNREGRGAVVSVRLPEVPS